MEAGSLEGSLARIEAALARIETAAARPAPADPQLAERHRQLKQAVAGSLAELDALIARQAR